MTDDIEYLTLDNKQGWFIGWLVFVGSTLILDSVAIWGIVHVFTNRG